MVSMFPATLTDRLGEELRDPAQACLQRQREGRCLGSRGWGGGAVASKPICCDQDFPSPFAHTDDGEDPRFPCSLPGRAPCLLGQLLEAPSSVGLPEPPPGRVTLANAPTHQDCGLSHIQNRPGAQMYSFSGSAAASWNNHGDSLP